MDQFKMETNTVGECFLNGSRTALEEAIGFYEKK